MEMQKMKGTEERSEEENKGKEERKPEADKLLEGKKDESEYQELKVPAEDIYSHPSSPCASATTIRDVQRRARLYLGLCIILALLSLILLLGICILGTARQSRCNDVEEKRCTPQECRPFCPDQALPCTNCDAGWHGFEGSCFYLSNDLHTWRESRDQCKKMAGDLAVIKNQRLQDFLVKKGTMMYWIGVTHVKSGMPFWVNDTVAESNLAGSQIEKCGFLIGRSDPNDKWKTTICSHSSAYICQK